MMAKWIGVLKPFFAFVIAMCAYLFGSFATVIDRESVRHFVLQEFMAGFYVDCLLYICI